MSELGSAIALIQALKMGPTDAQVTDAVDDWLDDHPEATTTVEDGSITNAKLASSFVTPGTAAAYSSSAKYAVGDYVFYGGTLYRCTTAITTAESWTAAHWTAAVIGSDVSELKSVVSNIVNDDYDFSEKTVKTTANSWKLDDTGLCSSDSDYKLVKYEVTAGDFLKVVSDHKFQFQTVASVPSSGSTNRVGSTYGSGTYYVIVPSTATYLIVSTTKENSTEKVYSSVTVTSGIETDIDNIENAIEEVYNGNIQIWKDNNVTGTRSVNKDVSISAGTYKLLIDSITSSDTDSTKSLIVFGNGYTNVATITLDRGVAISTDVVISENVNKLRFYASNTDDHSVGDTFTYAGVRIVKKYVDATLTKSGIPADALAAGTASKNFMHDEAFELSVLPISTLLSLSGFIKKDGAFQSNQYYKSSDYIRVKQGQVVKYNLRDPDSIAMLCFYTDRNKNTLVSHVDGTGSYSSGTFTAPSDGYIRAGCENYNFTQAYLYTELEPNKRNFGGDSVEKGLNVLLMGDSIFGSDGEIATYLSELCKSCTNGAFGGTRVSVRSSASDNFKYFDGVNIITALCTQTWTDQDSAATALSEQGYTWVPSRLSTLKAVDMSNIDLLIMDWGTNDYTADQTIDTITTAYGQVIDLLQETYPQLRILVTTPIWRYWGTEQDNVNGDNHAEFEGGPTLKEIALAIEEYMKNKRISVFNAYQNLPLSYKTASAYFDSGDTTHLNAFGNHVYAYLLHGKIRSIY